MSVMVPEVVREPGNSVGTTGSTTSEIFTTLKDVPWPIYRVLPLYARVRAFAVPGRFKVPASVGAPGVEIFTTCNS